MADKQASRKEVRLRVWIQVLDPQEIQISVLDFHGMSYGQPEI
jgi:hypothetical protein